jgi:hypothetical protein
MKQSLASRGRMPAAAKRLRQSLTGYWHRALALPQPDAEPA